MKGHVRHEGIVYLDKKGVTHIIRGKKARHVHPIRSREDALGKKYSA